MVVEAPADDPLPGPPPGLVRRFLASPACSIVRRIAVGVYEDGLIHAGNLAYMSLLAIFPFFVTGAAAVTLLGEEADRAAAVRALLSALPPVVDDVIQPVAIHVIEARTGWLLWVGGLVGLWTVGSLIETIRDILRRAYGAPATRAFWQYRLFSTGIIIVAVLLLILSLFLQVTVNAATEVIGAYFPQFTEALSRLAWTRIVSGVGLFGSIYLLFYTLTPARYRSRRYPKWPGAVLVTGWWVLVSMALPWAIRMLFAYDLTYGSLAGIMIALFFFYLVGLGMVAGAELNAALAGPQTRGRIGREADMAMGLQENS
ncbi:YihY/virulence factor BrkB family protein [Alteraurantiacibacter buctensis]|uniref:Ribonuclease BN n=1 Tax=Alteraurantiacibacter buctensis TaxID=1503981 RepID=A0A844YVS4_9SPHN|nr:YihY/virulence factor BrkB family protein [Alteraurantiacibacter buctensis]MXO70574.1 ribonuclease BN [Alteraurantiacibacter buctensis]